MIDAARLEPADEVVEVGPGLGFITAALSSQRCRVIAIEKDRTLAEYLRKKFAKFENLTIVEGDVLEVGIGTNAKIVSSPPYNISSKLTLSILNSYFRLAVLLLQKEFVNRLTAPPGSRNYGRLTVTLQCKASAEHIMNVPRSAFYPAPKVDSAIVRLEPKKVDPPIKNSALFEQLVRFLFTQRRRKLTGVLTRYLKKRNASKPHDRLLNEVNFLEKRIFEITPSELISLTNLLVDSRVEDETGSQNTDRTIREGR